MQCNYSRLSAIAAIVASGLVVAACGGSSSSGSSSGTAATSGANSSTPATTTYVSSKATVIGKSTAIVVNPALSAALKHADIAVTAVAPATAKRTLRFPISGGQITVKTLAGTIAHSGGLTFTHNGKSVKLTSFIINTQMKQLTAAVSGHSMPVFDLNHAKPTHVGSRHGTVVTSNIKLTVTPQAATALNSDLGVTTFKTSMKFGSARLTVTYARGRR